MPPTPLAGSPAEVSGALVAYWAAVIVAASACLVFVRGSEFSVLPALALSLAAAGAAYFSVTAVADIEATWSTGVFIWLAAAFTLGVGGIACVSIADAVGHALRYRGGWFKMTFNAATHVLELSASLAVFQVLGTRSVLVAGVSAGLVDLLVNSVLLMGAISIASRHIELRFWLRDTASFATYEAVYGLGAAAIYQLFPRLGAGAYIAILGTPLALQAFLVTLARRAYWFNEETRRHQEARVRLLQQAIDASNTERERIAASIHDGVVQDLVGLAFSLGAYAGIDLTELNEFDLRELAKLLGSGSETARTATRDLRTLIIEIASPRLKQDGLRAALDDLVHGVSGQVEATLNMPAEMDETAAQQKALVFRVAQEAVRNSVKYSDASTLSVDVNALDGQIVLLVADNGKGFSVVDRAKRQEEGHVGLTLLERTVKDGGGEFEVWSEPGHGTRVTMRLPLPDAPA